MPHIYSISLKYSKNTCYTQCQTMYLRTYEALKVRDIQLILKKDPNGTSIQQGSFIKKYRAVDCVLLELQRWEDLFLA